MKNSLGLVLGLWLAVLTGYIIYDKTADNVVYIDLIRVHDQFDLTKELSAEYDGIKNQQQNIMDSLVLKNPFEDQVKANQYLRNQNNQFVANMEKISTTYNNQIWKRINQYVIEYGNKNGLDFVFGTKGEGHVMYSKQNKDKTEEIIMYINSRYGGGI